MGHQELPRAGPERESLREKGQFWTPPWVAEAMVAYVLRHGAKSILDPAAGEGAFLDAAQKAGRALGRPISILGCEIDGRIVEEVLHRKFRGANVAIEQRDFVLDPPKRCADAIVANPPYIRHHRLHGPYKAQLRQFARATLGRVLDGRAGLHAYFLIRALTLLAPGGHLAFILPADVFEGVYARPLWEWIARRFRLDAVITFAPEATPFPGVDTNAVIVYIRNLPPAESYTWVRCNVRGSRQLRAWSSGSGCGENLVDLRIESRPIADSLATGLARDRAGLSGDHVTLGSLARVLRGIATGANDFFFMTRERAAALAIPLEYFVRAVGRTRDITSTELTRADLDALDSSGRPTYLLSLDGRPRTEFPASVRRYLEYGESLGLPGRPLVASRRPWYRMERREPPPFLFAYLGRRNCRFVRNRACAVPLTGFLCVYPLDANERSVSRLWTALSTSDLTAALRSVGKTYGGGAVKVEPRALERMPIPVQLLRRSHLCPRAQMVQLELV
jgi:hypothetical protein